jgi:hypothetical protein
MKIVLLIICTILLCTNYLSTACMPSIVLDFQGTSVLMTTWHAEGLPLYNGTVIMWSLVYRSTRYISV